MSFRMRRKALEQHELHKAANSDVPTLTLSKPYQFKIDRGDAILRTILRLKVTHDTGATPGTPTVHPRAPVGLLGDVVVKVNNHIERSLSADLLFCIAQAFRGPRKKLNLDSPTADELDAADAFPESSVDVPLDFVLPVKPAQGGLLDTHPRSKINLVQVSGVLGGVSSILDSPGATQDFSAYTLTPHNETVELEEHNGRMNFGAYLMRAGDQPITSTGQQSIKIEHAGRFVGVAFRTTKGSTNKAQDGIFTAGQYITIKKGGKVVWEEKTEDAITRTAAMLPPSFDRAGFIFALFPEDDSGILNMARAVPAADLLVEFHGTTDTNANIEFVPIVIGEIPEIAQARKVIGKVA